MTTIVMALEGVLTDTPVMDSLLNYEVADSGRETFNLLKAQARVILLSADPYEDRVKQWLLRERLTGYSMLYNAPIDRGVPIGTWRINKMTDMQGIGHHISYYVDTDPNTIAGALEVGITGLLLTRPGTYPGQGKGSETPAPWYSLVKRVDEQNALRANRAQKESEHGTSEA